MRKKLFVLFYLVLAVPTFISVARPVNAQVSDEEWERCEGARMNSPIVLTIDERINSCTQLIGSGRLSAAQTAMIYKIRGTHYYVKTLYEKAIGDLTQAIAYNPSFPDAYFWRGNAYLTENRHEAALADYNRALALKPEFTAVYVARGDYFAGLGSRDRFNPATKTQALSEYAQAISDYTRALDLKPELGLTVGLYWSRARAFEGIDQRDLAISDYRAALKLSPGDPNMEMELKRLGVAP
jgi:tetratricopeptide (TPR) repeat protein